MWVESWNSIRTKPILCSSKFWPWLIKKLFQIYLHKPLVFHFKNNSGLLLRNLSTGVALTMDAARQTLVMVFDIMLIIAAISLLIAFEPLVTMIAVLFLAVVARRH